jgi:hypothetical protein
MAAQAHLPCIPPMHLYAVLSDRRGPVALGSSWHARSHLLTMYDLLILSLHLCSAGACGHDGAGCHDGALVALSLGCRMCWSATCRMAPLAAEALQHPDGWPPRQCEVALCNRLAGPHSALQSEACSLLADAVGHGGEKQRNHIVLRHPLLCSAGPRFAPQLCRRPAGHEQQVEPLLKQLAPAMGDAAPLGALWPRLQALLRALAAACGADGVLALAPGDLDAVFV